MRRGAVHRRVAVEVQLVAVRAAHGRSGPVVGRLAAAYGVGQSAGQAEHDQHADDAGDPPESRPSSMKLAS